MFLFYKVVILIKTCVKASKLFLIVQKTVFTNNASLEMIFIAM